MQRETDIKWKGIIEAGWCCTFYVTVKSLHLSLGKLRKPLEAFMLFFGKLILAKGSGKNGSKNAILKSYFINSGEGFSALD